MAENNRIQQFVIIILMMTVAFYLQELPTSNVLQTALPEWPYLLTLYFAASSRYFFGVISAFVIGIIEDVFLGIPTMGLHAVIYVLAAFILIAGRLRFKHMRLPGQSSVIGLLVLAKVLIVMVYNAVLYVAPAHFWALLSVPLSMLLWPLLHLFFHFFASRHSV